MAILEKIMQLKQQGQTESQIADSLKQEGVSPKEINEALSQSKIKSTLNEQNTIMQPPQMPPVTSEIQQPPIQEAQMQPSIMQQQPAQAFPQQPQQTQEIPPSFQPSQMPVQEIQETQEPPQYQEYQPQETADIETINEIAEQIVDEKTNGLKKQISSFTKFKQELTLEIEKINQRLSKTEDALNQLQTAIIGKVGEYGKDIKNIAEEMHTTQDSFSKILNPLTDNIRELQKITGTQKKPSRPKPKTEKSKKQKPNFEDYLR